MEKYFVNFEYKNKEDKMKAIVTGGTGFIGSYLVEKLVQKKYQVFCIAKDKMHSANLTSLGVNIILGDINDGIHWESILKDANYIFHLAGVTRAKKVSDYFEGNFMATRRMSQISAQMCHNLHRFIYVSSLAAVGPSFNNTPVDEDSSYHPVSYYGQSKKLGEMEVLKLKDKLPFTIIRPSAVYGPRDRELLKYFSLIKNGIQPMIGFRKKWLNFIHRDDLVNGIIRAAESPAGKNEIFFLGGENNYSTEQLGDIIANIMQKIRVKLPLPESFVYLVGCISEIFGKISGKEVFFNRQKVSEAIQTYWTCSIEKAKRLLGFEETFSLEKGIQNTYDWYLKNNWLQ